MSDGTGVIERTETYYDSSEADAFYSHVWGGEDIHIGLYEGPDDSIFAASARTVAAMASRLNLDDETHVLDLGAGYGGAARSIASMYGCKVDCLNISEVQNDYNRKRCKEVGLEDKIEVVHGNFESIPGPDDHYDVVWSQDAILHSGARARVLAEIARVLKPGGQLIFTDPMQADDCPPDVLQPVLDRIHLDSLGSLQFYRKELEALGFEELGWIDHSHQLRNHYARVRKELDDRRDEMLEISGPDYVARMREGLGHWVDAADNGYLKWGILHFRLKK